MPPGARGHVSAQPAQDTVTSALDRETISVVVLGLRLAPHPVCTGHPVESHQRGRSSFYENARRWQRWLRPVKETLMLYLGVARITLGETRPVSLTPPVGEDLSQSRCMALDPILWIERSTAEAQPAAAGCTVPACADCLPVFCRGHLAGKTCICIAGARPDWALTFSGSVFLLKRRRDARLQGGGRSIQPADATGARRSAGRAVLTCTPNLLSAERPSSFITLDLPGLLFFYFSIFFFFCPSGTSASHLQVALLVSPHFLSRDCLTSRKQAARALTARTGPLPNFRYTAVRDIQKQTLLRLQHTVLQPLQSVHELPKVLTLPGTIQKLCVCSGQNSFFGAVEQRCQHWAWRLRMMDGRRPKWERGVNVARGGGQGGLSRSAVRMSMHQPQTRDSGYLERACVRKVHLFNAQIASLKNSKTAPGSLWSRKCEGALLFSATLCLAELLDRLCTSLGCALNYRTTSSFLALTSSPIPFVYSLHPAVHRPPWSASIFSVFPSGEKPSSTPRRLLGALQLQL
ncbi:hypothetical protein L1887_56837 [Cichorium endivia]|nr:hypothetical protein L1887_56837 [Cichorium endivia]